MGRCHLPIKTAAATRTVITITTITNPSRIILVINQLDAQKLVL